MADNFIDAVKEHMERLAAIENPPLDEIAGQAADLAATAVVPAVIEIVKQNNVEILRFVRNNPAAIRSR